MAERVSCDLIVMGARGRGGLGRLILGSVAEAVLQRAGCPVLTLKSPDVEWACRSGDSAREVVRA